MNLTVNGMSPKVVAKQKQDTKIALLEAGIDIMVEKGYNNTGIQEVLSSLGVPKGSFYHYFDSKEDYALAIIAYFDQSYSARLLRILRNPQKTPLDRLKEYCQTGRENLQSQQCRRGCLIGNLSQEMADQSETLRGALSQVMSKWRDQFAECIAEGQKTGEIGCKCAPAKVAELFLSGWEGAVMRAKTTKCVDPLDAFIEIMFEHMLKA